MKDLTRHRLAYYWGRKLLAPVMLKKYHFTTDYVKADYPCLVISNHTTEVDMAMTAKAMPRFMYFVCGEHLMRSKHAGLIKKYFDPILEFKAGSAVSTIKEILGRLKQGHSIMLFAEGSRSFNGETEKLDGSIGKLVKMSGAGLVTYRIRGGYFVAPRWGYEFRTGPMDGKVMHELSPAELKDLTAQQITDMINEDIYENAYATQRQRHDKYICEKGAEGLENYLIICPECGAYDSLETEGNTFRCSSCGHGGVYTEEGFLEGDGLKYDSVYDWGKWTDERFREDMSKKAPGERLFLETDLALYTVTGDHRQITELTHAEMAVYADRLEIGTHVFSFAELPKMSMLYYGKTLLFTSEGVHYGITGDHFHARKCNMLYDIFKETEHGPADEKKRMPK